MKKVIALSVISLSTLFTSVHASEACESRFKGLYKEIQIYNQTEKISQGDGLVGNRLETELKFLKTQNMSLKDKVHAIETGFARCDMELTEQDDTDIAIEVEALLKMKNPLVIE